MAEIDKYQFKYPPDIQKCQQHRLATRIFKGLQNDDTNNQCECCGRKIGSQIVQTPCCYSNLQLCFLGPGIPLLFSYILSSVVTLIILSIVFSSFALITNAVSGDCSTLPDCNGNVFNTLSIVNKINKQDYLSVQNYILLAFVVIFPLVMQCFRTNFRSIQEKCDQLFDSPSDYAIILKRLPPQTTKQDIEGMINEYKGFLDEDQKKETQNLRVVNIVLSYHMQDYLKAKQKNLDNFKAFVKDFNPQNFDPQPLPQMTQTASIAIVVFGRQQAKEIFTYKPNICQRFLYCFCDPCSPLSDNKINEQNISVERAPEPDDIVWENAQVSVTSAVLRKGIFNILSLCLLVAGGAAQYALAVAQNGQENDRIKLIYSVGASLIVALMNRITQQFLVFTSKMQGNQTLTQYNRVLMIKLSFFLFLNSGVFLVAANVIANTSQYRLDGELSYEITLVMILNVVTPNIGIMFVETCNLVNRVKIWLFKKQFLTLTQREANKIYETSYPQIPFKYGYVIKTLWLAAFYAPLVPIVVPISIFGLALNYWLQKWSYGKSYTAPNMIGNHVNNAAIELLEWIPLILAVGQFLIYLYFKNFKFGQLPEHWSIPLYISIAFSIIILFMPMKEINKKIFKLKSDSTIYPPYESVEQKFQVTYEMTNPAYKCTRKRKRDKNLWNLLFSDQNNRPYIQKQMNPFQQALLGGAQQQQIPFQQNPPPQNPPGYYQNPNPNQNNPFNMLKMNEGPSEYPSMDPIYNNNSNNNNEYNNTGNPFMYNRNL